MPNVINVNNACLTGTGNTGVGSCFNDLGIIRGAIFYPPNTPITASTIAAFKTAMAAAILNDNPLLRARPLQDIFEITIAGGDPITFTQAATQKQIVTADGYQSLTLRFGNGGMCLLIALRKANGRNTGILFFDDNGKLWGTKSQTADAIEAIPVYNYTSPVKIQTQPSELPTYSTMVSFDPYYMNDGLALLDFTNDGGLTYLQGLNGLQDVTILQGAARNAGALTVKAITSCGTVDFFDVYAAALAVSGAWKVRSKATKNPVAILSVTQSASNRGWVVTVDTADANYTATAGGLEVSLNGPTELAALASPVVGFESNYLAQ